MITEKTEILISAKTLVSSFLNPKYDSYARVLNEAIELFTTGQWTSGQIRHKLVKNRYSHL